jgi:hypothetical protein
MTTASALRSGGCPWSSPVVVDVRRVNDAAMADEVTLQQVRARATAVVAAATTWPEFPALWGQLLGEVWKCLRASGN